MRMRRKQMPKPMHQPGPVSGPVAVRVSGPVVVLVLVSVTLPVPVLPVMAHGPHNMC
jgi:hypothetical protein